MTSYLPPSVAARLAGQTFNPAPDPDAEVQAAAAARRIERWNATVDPRFADARLAGMIPAEQSAVVDWWNRGTGDLLLWSDTPGGGKTHTGYAVLNIAARTKGMLVGATTADELMDAHLAETHDSDLIRLAENAELLLIDELGKASRPGWVVNNLWKVYNARYKAKQRTIFTSNADLDTLAEAYPSLMSRITENGTILRIKHPDRRRKTAHIIG